MVLLPPDAAPPRVLASTVMFPVVVGLYDQRAGARRPREQRLPPLGWQRSAARELMR